MSIRNIQNLTIYSELNEQVSLPNEVMAVNDDLSVVYVPITWTPSTVNTSVQGDYVFLGDVSGYPKKVLLSCIVDGIDSDPLSLFPNEIDNFGNPKVDIQTADIPDIDDFQYFKAKYPRSATEGYQLAKLRELLADKVILARDINHLRNAVIEIEKFLKKLSDKVDELEKRVEKLEQETIINGKNLGSGEGVFKDVANRIMNFKSIVGSGGITVSSNGDEIQIEAPEEKPATAGCGVPVKGSSFNICQGSDGDAKFPMKITDGSFNITESGSFSFKMVDLKPSGTPPTVFPSLMIILGQGRTQTSSNVAGAGAGRVLKVESGYIFEVKNNNGSYSGLEITDDNVGFYNSVSVSKINKNLNSISDAYDLSQL